jgi:hypothetical protein
MITVDLETARSARAGMSGCESRYEIAAAFGARGGELDADAVSGEERQIAAQRRLPLRRHAGRAWRVTASRRLVTVPSS